ncbi:MAG: hypothetical protein AAF554_13065 [Bacteroidota bacterium]
MYKYLFVGVAFLILAIVLYDIKSGTNPYETDKSWRTSSLSKQQEKRTLKLVVAYDSGQRLKTISENASQEIIKSTMESINWNEFHIVQLEDNRNNDFKALHVSGSLGADGLASGFVTENEHILLVEPPETVDQMIEILLDFLKGEETWRNKYVYE